MDDIISHPSFLLFFTGMVFIGLWRFSTIFSSSRADAFPRIGPEPNASDNKQFLTESLQMIEEGYSKYKDGIYKLWTIDMDRLIISHKFMSDINKLPRSSVRLTTSERYEYTGMDICEESNLQYEVCAGALTRNIGPLGQTAYDEIVFALNEKFKTIPKEKGIYSRGSEEPSLINDIDSYSLPLFISLIDLVTSSTARIFVGSDLCRNPEWLSTATGYTMDVQKASEELLTYPSFLRPIVVNFLKSYKQLRSRFFIASRLLLPEFEKRSLAKNQNEKGQHQDMLQWLVDSAQGRDAEPERLVRRMLFLNMAAIHTTAITATNVFLDLCARPECMEMLRQEILEVLEEDGGIKSSTLPKLKKLDSFMRESRRLNTMGFLTFQRRLTVPFTLSNGTRLPKDSYLSMAYYPIARDPSYYPSPLTFDPLRFYNLRQKEGEEEKHQFASVEASEPLWTFGKFACPGRHWATAQIKLLVMVFLIEFEISYPEGQIERPENKIIGSKCMPSVTQKVVLKRRI